MPDTKVSHDSFYKTLFSNPKMVKDLILDFIPEPFVSDFDFSTLEICHNAYVTPHLAQRQNDLVWRVRWKDSVCYIYIILEFQSSQDHWMALRILTYTALLWESLIKTEEFKNQKFLPPILPIVIYNGKRPWNCAKNISDLVMPIPEAMKAYQPKQKYYLMDENSVGHDAVNASDGIYAYVLKFEQADNQTDFINILEEFVQKLNNPDFIAIKKEFFTWLKQVFLKYEDSSDLTFYENLNFGGTSMIEETVRGWIEDYKKEGRIAGMKTILLDTLTSRFGHINPIWEEKIALLDKREDFNKLIEHIYLSNNDDSFSTLLNQIVDKRKLA